MPAISSAIAIAGLAASAGGAYASYSGAKGQAGATNQITGLQLQAEQQRKIAMEVGARRQQMEVLRNAQRARSLSLNNATSQGAQFGSGLSGGMGQISGQSGVNLLAINQNLQTGENLFGINSQISQQKIAYANYGSQVALGSGISSLGGSLMNSSKQLNNIFGNFGGSSPTVPSTSNSGGRG